MFTDDDLRELRAVIKDQIASSETARQLKKNILDETATFEDYRSNYKNIAFYLTLFVAENGDYYDNEVVELLNSKIGSIVYELFDNVSAGYESANRVAEDLRKQSGYREDDIRKILFQSYQNLYGEIESRSVQSSRLVESQYKNYFFLTRWEMGPIQQLVVIDGADTIIDTQKIQAAVEKKDDQYVIHLQKDFSCVPILHELGHIVFDALVKLGYEDQIKVEMKKTLDRDVDEYFVYQFLAYIRETINDDSVTNDILEDKIVEKNKVISEILDDFFTDRETTDRLKYLQNLLSMV